MKARRKPIEVEYMQLTNSGKDQVLSWAQSLQMSVYDSFDNDNNPIIKIPTLQGIMICEIGDYIIKEPFPTDHRKVYPCKKEIFEQTYDIL